MTQTGAKITWTASTDNVAVTGYNVYVGETKVNATPVTVTEYDLTGEELLNLVEKKGRVL